MQNTLDTASTFAQLLNSSDQFAPRQIDTETVFVEGVYRGNGFVDYGGKFDAVIAASELEELQLVEGERYRFQVVALGYEEEECGRGEHEQLTRVSYLKAKAWNDVEAAQSSGKVLNVTSCRVARSKGDRSVAGLRVTIGEGPLTGFVPLSGLVAARLTHEDREALVKSFRDKTFPAKVANIEPGRSVVLRHALALPRRDGERGAVTEALSVGTRCTGAVRNITPYGVFVDVGGVQGLVHISQMPNQSTEGMVRGAFVEVSVIKIDNDGKVGLSLTRALQEDILSRLEVGSIIEGKVKHTVEYGAFVTIDESLSLAGLLHINDCPRSFRAQPGELLRVRVAKVDIARGRVSLSLRDVPRAS